MYVRYATEDELPEMVQVGSAAFRDGALSRMIFPERLKVNPGTQDEDTWRLERTRAQFPLSNKHFIVAVEEVPAGEGKSDEKKEEIAGIAIWKAPSTPEESKREEDAMKLEEGYVPGFDREAFFSIRAQAKDFTIKHMGERGTKDYWVLDAIGTSPKYQRRGVGTLLVRWGLEQAAKSGNDVWLIATAQGRYLYTALDFDIIGELELGGEIQTQMIKKTKVEK